MLQEDKVQVLNLLKTARGQVDGIIRMVEDDRYCVWIFPSKYCRYRLC